MKFKIISGIGFLLLILFFSCGNDTQAEFNRSYSGGSVIYQSHCQNCHGVHGEGLQELIPPLNDQLFLKSNKKLLPCFVGNGLKGKIVISKKMFEGQMPRNDLAPIEIAKVLTFVTNSFGNKLGIITLDEVNNNLAKCQ